LADPAGQSDSLRWVHVGALDQIPVLGARVLRVVDVSIAVFRTSDDRVFALLDRCPHRGGPLSQGIVHGNCVTCPLHDWVIDLSTGEATGPDEGTTKRFPVHIEDGSVWLGVSDDLSGFADASKRRTGSTVTATLTAVR
jgi:nitrite reductase (NADH) small subunit